MMTYEQFEALFPEAVRKALPEEYHECNIRRFASLNGDKMFSFKEGKSFPTIIPSYWFWLMIEKNNTVEEVAIFAANWYAEMINEGLSLEDFRKENIFPVLLSKEESEKLKGIAPMRPFLDLMIGFRIILNPEPDLLVKEIRTSVLNYGTLQILEMTEEELWRDYSYTFPEILKPGYVSMASIFGDDPGIPMYVISNSSSLYGSAAILITDILEELCDRMGCDSLMLFPSSIHEIIAFDESLSSLKEFVDLLWFINQNRVAPQDRLSNHLYIYANRAIHSTEIILENMPA